MLRLINFILHSCSFLPVLNKNGKDMRESLMETVSHLCQVPVPPPGPISIVSEEVILIG